MLEEQVDKYKEQLDDYKDLYTRQTNDFLQLRKSLPFDDDAYIELDKLRHEVDRQSKYMNTQQQRLTEVQNVLLEYESKCQPLESEIKRLTRENLSMASTITALENELSQKTSAEVELQSKLIDVTAKLDKAIAVRMCSCMLKLLLLELIHSGRPRIPN